MEVPIKNVNISNDLRLKLWKNRNIINLARKVNNIVDIYNDRSRNYEYTGFSTPK